MKSGTSSQIPLIDAHHHLWRYQAAEYPWIESKSVLARDYLLPELDAVCLASGISGTIAVQARQTTAESDFLLDLATSSPQILGVVGWVPLIDPDVDEHLARLSASPVFSGARHVLQDEPEDYFLRDDFHHGLSRLAAHGMRYDLLIYQHQIPSAIQLVDRQPSLEIVVDHIAKPAVRPGQVDPAWKAGMRELAKRDHVRGVKFSGLATEFPNDQAIDPATVRAYFDATLEIFGPRRVMFGTDWPVCLLRLPHASWTSSVRELVSSLSRDEQVEILSGNARRIYALKEFNPLSNTR